MHSGLLPKDPLMHINTQVCVCVYALSGAGHRSQTEGFSLAQCSAALPDLHVKQVALTPPLLHSPLFLMSSSSLQPRPPSQSLHNPAPVELDIWMLLQPCCTCPNSKLVLTQTKNRAQCAAYSNIHSAFV